MVSCSLKDGNHKTIVLSNIPALWLFRPQCKYLIKAFSSRTSASFSFAVRSAPPSTRKNILSSQNNEKILSSIVFIWLHRKHFWFVSFVGCHLLCIRFVCSVTLQSYRRNYKSHCKCVMHRLLPFFYFLGVNPHKTVWLHSWFPRLILPKTKTNPP